MATQSNTMNDALKYGLLILCMPLIAVCRTNLQKAGVPQISPPAADDRARGNIAVPEIILGKKDTAVPHALTKRLKPIRENFKRINAITNWSKVDTTDPGNALEGSEARLYYYNGKMEKIIASYWGETYQQIDEYYLLNGNLSFVFEKTYRYNRPIYYDSAAMKAAQDTAAFDFDKSTIIEVRSYFDNGKLFYRLNSRNNTSPITAGYLLQEQTRILTDFKRLKKPGD